MNHTKLKTENSNTLLVKSMSKFHTITHLSFNEVGHDFLYKNHDVIGVSHIPNEENTTLLALQYGGDTELNLSDESSEEHPCLNMYMRVFDGNYYQIAAVFTDVKKANDFMTQRPDTALIDSTMLNLDDEYHFIARLEKAKVLKK